MKRNSGDRPLEAFWEKSSLVQLDHGLLVALSAVARDGSFEAAAKSLGLSQSAISQRIKQIEKNLGTILIRRDRPCVPTSAGLKLIEHLEKVSLLQNELQERLGELGVHGGNALRHDVPQSGRSKRTGMQFNAFLHKVSQPFPNTRSCLDLRD